MGRKVAYWVTTGLIALMALFGGFEYLRASPEAVAGFAHVGYPQQLRVLLGIAKLAGALTLVAPGLLLVKEWAYAGFAFAWIAAAIAHYLAGDSPEYLMPIFLLGVLTVSYLTRPGHRRVAARPAMS